MLTIKEIEKKANSQTSYKWDKEVQMFVASAPLLGIVSQGRDSDEAKLALEDAIHSFLTVAQKHNLLEKCLKNTVFASI